MFSGGNETPQAWQLAGFRVDAAWRAGGWPQNL